MNSQNPTGNTDPIIEVDSVTFKYQMKVYDEAANPYGPVPEKPREEKPEDYVASLQDVSFTCQPGTITLLCGASGSGKSTALRLLNGLVPHFHSGVLSGKITVDGQEVENAPIAEMGASSATVFQNPRTQFFTGEVFSELAFRGENYGEDPEDIRARSHQALEKIGIEYLKNARFTQMSGGELQKVACAQALVSGSKVLLFDEPTSNLSPEAIRDFTKLLAELKAEGHTIVVAEHRLYFLNGLADHVLILENGKIAHRFTGKDFFALSDNQRKELGLRSLEIPHYQIGDIAHDTGQEKGIQIRNLEFAYRGNRVLYIDQAAFPAGQVTALVGDNGVGKTTLSKVLSGLAKPGKNTKITLDGKDTKPAQLTKAAYVVMQDVNRQLFSDSVLGEVTLGKASSADNEKAKELLTEMDLVEHVERHPLSLSGGQKQRLVIASALASDKKIYIFDEPTSGVDYRHLQAISARLKSLAQSGAVVIVITHDPELISICADSVAVLRAYNPDEPASQLIRYSIDKSQTRTEKPDMSQPEADSHEAEQTSSTKDLENGSEQENRAASNKTQTAPAANDDRLGQKGLTRTHDASEDDNKAKNKAGAQAIKRLTKPVAGTMLVARIMAELSAVLAVVPYVALVYLGGLLLEAYKNSTPVDADRAWFMLMVLIGAFTTRLGLYMLALALTHFADNRLRAHIRNLIIERIGRAPLSWFSATNSGRIRKAVQDDAAQVHTLVAHAPVEMTAAMVMPLALLVYAFIIDWRLGLLSIAVFPVYGGFYAYMMRGMGEKTAEMDTRMDKISSTMVEFVAGITVVKAFGRVGRSHRNYATAANEFSVFYNDWCQPLLRGSAIAMAIIAVPVVLAVNLGGGYLLVQGGYVTAVQVVSSSLIALVIPSSLIVLGNGAWSYQLAGAAALRIYEVIDTAQLEEANEPVIPVHTNITFENVCFSYGKTKAVDNVSLELPEGSVTALIGPSGSGKSTLATMVARFSDVDSGSVKIGGVDVRQIPTTELYKKVAFVLQDPQLLRATIGENISLGKPGASLDEIRQAAQAAYIDDFINGLPKGYDTVIGEDTNLSGGQAQRIAIARALLIDAPVLLLDEATAFTDPDSEAEIQAALSRLAQGRTVLAIAHRPASIIGADKIVVMERGQVIASGTHEELKNQPHYRSIWERSGQSQEAVTVGGAENRGEGE